MPQCLMVVEQFNPWEYYCPNVWEAPENTSMNENRQNFTPQRRCRFHYHAHRSTILALKCRTLSIFTREGECTPPSGVTIVNSIENSAVQLLHVPANLNFRQCFHYLKFGRITVVSSRSLKKKRSFSPPQREKKFGKFCGTSN